MPLASHLLRMLASCSWAGKKISSASSKEFMSAQVLDSFDASLNDFVKVMPMDYKRVLAQLAAEEAAEPVAAAN